GARDVLITSISKKIPLIQCVRRALAKFDPGARVHGADSDPEALGQHFVDVFWVAPSLDRDAGASLIEHCRRNGIRFLIPTRDGELLFFSRLRDEFSAAGIEVLVSSPEAVASCIDKLSFAELLQRHGLPAIPTAESLEAFEGFPSVVVKDRFGSGSKNLHCDVAPEVAEEVAKGIGSPIYQPFVRGREYSIDLYRDRLGCVHGTVCRTRDTVVGGESQVTTVVDAPDLEVLCAKVVEVLDYNGHATLQAIELPTGQFQMLECNARFGGASTLSERAGLESFYWFFAEASGRGLTSAPFTPTRDRLRLVRHATDSFVSQASA
ncbi:MAG: ATP-grasp domain-containing protein, partial [bacterium]|nr:ATP-grasp domain-containing protein [bacterium]